MQRPLSGTAGIFPPRDWLTMTCNNSSICDKLEQKNCYEFADMTHKRDPPLRMFESKALSKADAEILASSIQMNITASIFE